MRKVDTVIIGAGTAGLAALREVRRRTDDFLIINDGHWGTTCAHDGCMPSKALIAAANILHSRHLMPTMGLTGAEALRADIPAVLARVRRLRDDFVQGPAATPGELGARAIQGRATLAGPNRVVVGAEEIATRAIILAVGSSPIVPAPMGEFGDRILTTDTLFEQHDLPPRIAVIGMGSIGVEIAQALARLGISVAGFDSDEGLAGIDDADVLDVFRGALGREIELHLGARAEVAAQEDGLRVTGAGGEFIADKVLAAMGRAPNINDLGLETLGVALDDKGMPTLDPETLRIGELPVFLVGDANADRPILHEAADEGHIAGCASAPDGADTPFHRRTAMSIVFASPQIVRVGPPLSEIEGAGLISASTSFAGQGRARVMGVAEGVLRVHADAAGGTILAAEMCAPAAEHMAHLLALAIEQGLTVSDMLAAPFYHPVLEEGLRSALRKLQSQLPGRRGSELSDCDPIGHAALE